MECDLWGQEEQKSKLHGEFKTHLGAWDAPRKYRCRCLLGFLVLAACQNSVPLQEPIPVISSTSHLT